MGQARFGRRARGAIRGAARLAVLAALAAFGPAGAQDVAEGETLYQGVCRNCHGPKAQGMASFPKLVGLGVERISDRLRQYRAQETVGPNSPLMWPVAADLSDQDIQNLAVYVETGLD